MPALIAECGRGLHAEGGEPEFEAIEEACTSSTITVLKRTRWSIFEAAKSEYESLELGKLQWLARTEALEALGRLEQLKLRVAAGEGVTLPRFLAAPPLPRAQSRLP